MSEPLTLYHGSRQGLTGRIRPDAGVGSADFGAGFYMGTDPNQPKTLICREPSPVFYTLDFDLSGLRVHTFAVDTEWALFVAFNRGKMATYRDTVPYRRFERLRAENDVFVGKIADDRMFNVMAGFFEGTIASTPLIACMTSLDIGTQYCAVTERACAQIRVRDEQRLDATECAHLREQSADRRKEALAAVDRICREHRREGEFIDELIEKWGAAK